MHEVDVELGGDLAVQRLQELLELDRPPGSPEPSERHVAVA
jgi:hypothetical protein